MTGYGVGNVRGAFGEFVAEIRSVNNRHLDLSVRLPKELAFLEILVRDVVRSQVGRGKVDVFVRWTPSPTMPPLAELNVSLLRHYIEKLLPLADVTGTCTLDLGALLSLPGVVNPSAVALDTPILEAGLREALHIALESLNMARASEGQALGDAIRQHLVAFEHCVAAVEQLKP
ncbi:MAG: YicC/YloC family endoribonuclease, partial [Candidatus Sumerlaeaceae bacterium]